MRKERQKALLLSSALFFAVFAILLAAAIAEYGAIATRLSWVAVAALAVSGLLFIVWATDVTLERRPWASDNPGYNRLKHKTLKELKKHPGLRQHTRINFMMAARQFGVNGIEAANDFDKLQRRAGIWM